jgi:CRISPR-associated protein Cmr2
MSTANEVLVLWFGPVQGFVAASRKTRDLTLGSRLLSDLAVAAGRGLHGVPGVVQMVVPPPEALVSGDGAGVSNKLVLVVEGDRVEEVATAAREAAGERLQQIKEAALKRVPRDAVDLSAVEAQVERFLEFAWASAPLPSTEGFGEARRRAEELLDGRKALRDFLPYFGTGNAEKASVDGRLPGVIADGRKLRRRGPGVIKQGEQLDAMGLVRRFWRAPRVQSVPSTAGIAVKPWLRAIESSPADRARLERAEQAREALMEAIRTHLSSDPELEVFDEEYAWVLEDANVRKRDLDALPDVPFGTIEAEARTFENAVDDLINNREWPGRPTPYFAIITADGDGMGRAFTGLARADAQQTASQRLADFAGAVQRVGDRLDVHVAYAGGDDLLALAPLDQALPFIRQVRQEFEGVREAFPDPAPTLSVGLAIVHEGDSLGRSIRSARTAEHVAKSDGDATGNRLALLLSKRSGGDLWAVLHFDRDPVTLLDELVARLRQGEVSRNFAHELANVAPTLGSVPLDMARLEVERILGRKQTRAGAAIDKTLSERLMRLSGIETAATREAFVEACLHLSVLLRVALHLAEHTQPRPSSATTNPATGEAAR